MPAPAFDTGEPISFFTNVASRLLASGLNLDLNRIQVYPTNRYTPAVNRLLQVAANVYDATATNYYPTVFRPLFSRDADGLGTNVFISGYTNVSSVSGFDDSQLFVPIDALDLSLMDGPVTNLAVNVYGIPWIIGAKKGFPNFNEFSMQNIVQITRKLQVTRTVTNLTPRFPEYDTNQMYIFGITNSLGIECWNSYTNDYSNTVQIVVKDHLSMTLTNAGSLSISSNYYFFVATNVTFWPGCVWGYNYLDQRYSTPFVIALETNVTFLPTSVYRFGTESFVPATSSTPWETNMVPSLVQLPHFGLATTNYLQFFMIESNHVIDYVHWNGPASRRDLSAELNKPDQFDPKGLWQTNLQGVYNQLVLSRGLFVPNAVPSEDGGKWEKPAGVGGVNTPPQDEAYFGALFMTNNRAYAPSMGSYSSAVEVNLSFGTQAPYTPTRTMYEFITWQANDPLVHHLASDLQYSGTSYTAGGDSLETGVTNSDRAPVPYLPNIGNVNDRYAPWGTHGPFVIGADTNVFNLAYKDPRMFRSDNWNFPATNFPSFGWLGRIHRGTPWQTVFLKSSNILAYVDVGVSLASGAITWTNWTGNADPADAAAMAPMQDWHVAGRLMSMLNTNDARLLASVNNPDPNAWLVLLDGLTVWTNTIPNQFDLIIISSNSPQASLIANLIETTRASQANQSFRNIGDILAIPQLTEQSPFLNGNDSGPQQYGISDEAYEAIPSQLLPLLRTDSSGTLLSTSGQMQVQFSGDDGQAYAVQVSPDLVNWTSISTNSPIGGVFHLPLLPAGDSPRQFYRSLLLP